MKNWQINYIENSIHKNKERYSQNLTQSQLAKRIGITQQHLSKIENGEFSNILTLEKVLLFIGYKIKIEAVPLPLKIIKRTSPSKITKLRPQIA